MSKSKLIAQGVFTALLLGVATPVFAADACPDLSGTFDCPASGKQPPMTLTVTNKATVDGGMSYKFVYRMMGRDMTTESEGVPSGNRKADPLNLCSSGAYTHKAAGEAGDGTRMLINASGDFERSSGGKVEMTCVRKKK